MRSATCVRNVVTVTYPSNDQWVVTETDGRRHEIDFFPASADFKPYVKEIRLASHEGEVATYGFRYETESRLPGCSQDPQQSSEPYSVPLLLDLTQPDGFQVRLQDRADGVGDSMLVRRGLAGRGDAAQRGADRVGLRSDL